MRLLAQKLKIGNQEIEGPLRLTRPGGEAIANPTIADLISVILSFLYPIASILLFFFLVWGGFDILVSQGNAEKLESGKKKISAALVGFFLLILSYLVVRLIAYIFGLGGGIF